MTETLSAPTTPWNVRPLLGAAQDLAPTAIGVVDAERPDVVRFPIRGIEPHHQRVRLMVRRGGRPVGFVELDAHGETLAPAAVDAAIAAVSPASVSLTSDGPATNASATGTSAADTSATGTSAADTSASIGPVSVIVCTRDREDQLRRCLRSVLDQARPDDEVVVVDNAPRTGATRAVVQQLADRRLRYVLEPRPGLSVARNRGVREARNEVLAFTDDDVLADTLWLDHVRSAVGSTGAGCVTGLVPSAELESRWQHYFERRIAWGAALQPQVFHRDDDRGPLYPFSAGIFGTGANLTITRTTFATVGAFDEGLGAGRTTRGGEDLDYFLRIIRAGVSIAYEPAAVIWHVHRPDEESFREQLTGYGVGFGAYAAKVLLDPRTALPLLLRLPKGVRKLRSETDRVQADGGVPQEYISLELRGMLRGPVALLRERLTAVRHRLRTARRPV